MAYLVTHSVRWTDGYEIDELREFSYLLVTNTVRDALAYVFNDADPAEDWRLESHGDDSWSLSCGNKYDDGEEQYFVGPVDDLDVRDAQILCAQS